MIAWSKVSARILFLSFSINIISRFSLLSVKLFIFAEPKYIHFMKKSILILSFQLILTISALAQKPVYEIQKIGDKYTQTDVEKAFENSNFCGLINPDKDYTILFDDGTKVVIFSAQLAKGFESSCVRENNVLENDILWSIKSGVLIRPMSTLYNKKS